MEQHAASIAKYDRLKSRALEIRSYYKQHLSEYADRREHRASINLSQCANYLVFNNYYTLDQVRLVKASTCKQHLLCPFCAARRASKLIQVNEPKVSQVLETTNWFPVMITLTVKNSHDFEECFDNLVQSFRRLLERRRDWLKKGRGITQFRHVQGGYYSIEITHDPETGYHPHIHLAAICSSYLDQKKLSDEWHEVTGDSFVVSLNKIKGDSLVEGLLEVFKYALKFSDLDDEQVWEMWRRLSGKRLIGSFGCLWGLKMPENELDDVLEDLPFIEMLYVYGKSGSYSIEESKHFESEAARRAEAERVTAEKLERQRISDHYTERNRHRPPEFRLE